MPITINNYETYFIDYHDGVLSPGQVAELFLFLEQHPRIREEFEDYAGIQLDATGESFPIKENLKRGHVTSENLSWYLVAAMENDLDADETKQLNKFLDAHPAARRDAALFNATRLEPGNEKFDEKRDLKKPVPFTIVYRKAIQYAVAAMLLLGIVGGAAYLLNRSSFVDEQRLAQSEQSAATKQEAQLPAASVSPLENVLPDSTTTPENQKEKDLVQQPATGSTDAINDEVKTGVNLAEKQVSIDTVVPVMVLPASEIALSLDQSIVNFSEAGSLTDIRPASGDERYMTVWEALRKASSKEVQRLTGQPEQDEPLAFADQPVTGLADLVGNGLSKLTNEKVSYTSRSDESGRKSGFRFNLGGISIEK